MHDAVARHADLVADLVSAVYESAGAIDPAVRRAVGAGVAVSETWKPYADKVRDHSHRITDGDITALKAAGRSEEEIFEITIAVATGAGLARLDVGLRAMQDEA